MDFSAPPFAAIHPRLDTNAFRNYMLDLSRSNVITFVELAVVVVAARLQCLLLQLVHVLDQSTVKHKIRLGGIDAPEKK